MKNLFYISFFFFPSLIIAQTCELNFANYPSSTYNSSSCTYTIDGIPMELECFYCSPPQICTTPNVNDEVHNAIIQKSDFPHTPGTDVTFILDSGGCLGDFWYTLVYNGGTTINGFNDTLVITGMDSLDYFILSDLECGLYASWLTPVKFIYTCSPPCDIPLTGVSALVLDSTRAAVVWDASPTAGFFKFQYRELGTTTWTLVNVKNQPYQRVAWIINGLTKNKTYQYRVRQQCPNLSAGPYSSIQTFNTFTSSTCDIPAASKVVFMSVPDKVRLFIDYEPSAEKFDVRWRLQGTVPVIGNKIFRKATTVISGLSPSTDYEYRIRTKCNGVWTGYSAWQRFSTNAVLPPISPPSSSREDISTTTLDLYPNPVNQTLNVEFKHSGEKHIRLLDIAGLIVLDKIVQDKTLALDVSSIPKGAYFLQVVLADESIITKKVIKF